jgi:tyrosyl-tRNA synthetase
MDLLDDLEARGLVHDSTDRAALRERLAAGPITLYHGIDPTADSLHIGHLLGLVTLRRFQMAGHRPIALAGGATGMVGDPSGRSDERNLLDEATLGHNVEAIKQQIARVLGDDARWDLVDNYEWTKDISVLDFLRDVGKHVTVNQMVARESVKARMQSEHGISFTEFSYMLLQANDYWWLHENMGCELQIGGSDQWGNILSGVDLIRRRSGAAAHALCWPLLTAADGSKLGKTTGARTWLDPARTSPHELYQHFVQVDDSQVWQQLAWFTVLPVPEIDALVAEHERLPADRLAQRRLAREVTALVHGEEAAALAESGTAAFRGALDGASLAALEGTIPTAYLGQAPASLEITAVLVHAGAAPSKSAATRLLEQGGISLNGVRLADTAGILEPSQFVEGRWGLLSVGKRKRHLLVLADEPSGGVDVPAVDQ